MKILQKLNPRYWFKRKPAPKPYRIPRGELDRAVRKQVDKLSNGVYPADITKGLQPITVETVTARVHGDGFKFSEGSSPRSKVAGVLRRMVKRKQLAIDGAAAAGETGMMAVVYRVPAPPPTDDGALEDLASVGSLTRILAQADCNEDDSDD